MMLMVLMMNMMILEKMRSTKDLVTGHLKILWLHTNVTHMTISIILMRTQLSKRHNYDIEYEDLGDDKDDDVDGLDGQPHLVQEETKQQGVHRCQPGTQLQITEITFSMTSSREKKKIQNFWILSIVIQKVLTCLHPLCCVVWGQWCSGELGNRQRKKRDGQTIVRKKDKKLEKFWVGGDPVVLQWVGEKERDGQTIVCKRSFGWVTTIVCKTMITNNIRTTTTIKTTMITKTTTTIYTTTMATMMTGLTVLVTRNWCGGERASSTWDRISIFKFIIGIVTIVIVIVIIIGIAIININVPIITWGLVKGDLSLHSLTLETLNSSSRRSCNKEQCLINHQGSHDIAVLIIIELLVLVLVYWIWGPLMGKNELDKRHVRDRRETNIKYMICVMFTPIAFIHFVIL